MGRDLIGRSIYLCPLSRGGRLCQGRHGRVILFGNPAFFVVEHLPSYQKARLWQNYYNCASYRRTYYFPQYLNNDLFSLYSPLGRFLVNQIQGPEGSSKTNFI